MVHELAEQAIEMAEQAQEMNEKDAESKDIAESHIVGQAKLYILEKRHKVQVNNSFEFSGPNFTERSWNSRPLSKAAAQELATINGGRIYPLIQQHAIIVAISETLLEGVNLSPYNSHIFNTVSFKENATGEIHIINGHHRIEAMIIKHKYLLDQYNQCQKLLSKDFKVASDADTEEIIHAREVLKTLEEKLLENGCWGAVILNYGKHSVFALYYSLIQSIIQSAPM